MGDKDYKFKYDKDSPRADLLLDVGGALLEVSKLLTLGAEKYEASSWLSVPNGETRYTAALFRHLLASKREDLDRDSGFNHDVSVAANALFRLELRLRREALDIKEAKSEISYLAPLEFTHEEDLVSEDLNSEDEDEVVHELGSWVCPLCRQVLESRHDGGPSYCVNPKCKLCKEAFEDEC